MMDDFLDTFLPKSRRSISSSLLNCDDFPGMMMCYPIKLCNTSISTFSNGSNKIKDVELDRRDVSESRHLVKGQQNMNFVLWYSTTAIFYTMHPWDLDPKIYKVSS